MVAWVPMSAARSAPQFFIALFALLVCAISIGHAEPGAAETCSAIETGLPAAGVLTSPGNIVGVLTSSPTLLCPQPSVWSIPVSAAGEAARQSFADTRTPRAPPAI
jgi:hypothetical protein